MKPWQWFALAAGAVALFLFSRRGGLTGVLATVTPLPANAAVPYGVGGVAPSTPGYSNEVIDPVAPSVPLPSVDPQPRTAFKPPRTTPKIVPPSTGPTIETRSGVGHF